MKALFINAIAGTVTETEIKDWRDIAPKIGAEYFSCPVTLENGDTLYCDEEALLTGPEHFFLWSEAYPEPLAGSALLIGGNNRTGESCDVKTTAAELENKIKFLSIGEVRNMYGV